MKVPSLALPAANRQLVLRTRPESSPRAEHFASETQPIPVPAMGTFLVRNLFLAVDPVQRGWALNSAVMPLGQPMRALAVGIVIDSRDPAVASGEMVYGFFGWQDFAVATRQDLLYRTADPQAPLPVYAGMLGMPGVTAWLALNLIAPPREGQTVLVSTAAGTVGCLVGQIARRRGARVVGLTGSANKARMCVEQFGYHQAFDYRTCDLDSILAEACPAGVDTFFDNTGGPILDSGMRHMARFGRIIQCGTAATPGWNPPPLGLRNEREILMRALTWTGFVVFDHIDRFPEAIDQLSAMAESGELVCPAEYASGMDGIPEAVEALFLPGSNPPRLFNISDSEIG